MLTAFTLASRLWKQPAIRGLALVAGMLVAISAHGHLRFRDGVAAGIRAEKHVRDSVQRIADAAEDRARAETDSIIRALRVSLVQRDRDLQIAKQAAALASGRYAAAQEAYDALKAAKLASGDTTTTPMERACEAVAATCAATVRAKEAEVAAVEAKLATAEALSAAKDTVIATEPQRVSRSVRVAVDQVKAAQPKPNRIGWFAAGTIVGVLLEVLR